MYRVDAKGGMERVKECSSNLFGKTRGAPESDMSSVPGRRRRRRDKRADRSKYMKTAIRSKNHLLKLLEAQPIPSTHLCMVAGLALFVCFCVVSAAVQHFVFTRVFDWLITELAQSEYINDITVYVYESWLWILQMDLLNSYSVYPFIRK